MVCYRLASKGGVRAHRHTKQDAPFAVAWILALPLRDLAPRLGNARVCGQRARLTSGAELGRWSEHVRLSVTQVSGETPGLGQIIDGDRLAAFEKRIHSLAIRLLKQLVNVGRPDAELTREGALRETRAALEPRLPSEELDDPALAVGTEPL